MDSPRKETKPTHTRWTKRRQITMEAFPAVQSSMARSDRFHSPRSDCPAGRDSFFFFSFLNGEKHIPLAAYFYFLFDQFKLFRSVSYSLTRLYFIEDSTSNRIHFHTHWQTKESEYQFSQRSNVSINIPVDLSIISFLSALFLSFENRKWHQISKTKWQKGIQRKI